MIPAHSERYVHFRKPGVPKIARSWARMRHPREEQNCVKPRLGSSAQWHISRRDMADNLIRVSLDL